MKKYNFLFIVYIMSILATVLISYHVGVNVGEQSSVNEKVSILQSPPPTSIAKIDYPLIDIAFNDGSDWIVVIRDGIDMENSSYKISHDEKELQINKEYLSVATFPAGRGTTADGCVYVYKDGELVKSVEYIECCFENENIMKAFENVTQKEFEKIVNFKW